MSPEQDLMVFVPHSNPDGQPMSSISKLTVKCIMIPDGILVSTDVGMVDGIPVSTDVGIAVGSGDGHGTVKNAVFRYSLQSARR